EDEDVDSGDGSARRSVALAFAREVAVLDRPRGGEGGAFGPGGPFPQEASPEGVLLAVMKSGPAPVEAGEESALHERAFARAVDDIEGVPGEAAKGSGRI